MAIQNFIPEVWSASVVEAFQASQVIIPTLTNTFVGEVAFGNVVNITGAVTPTIVNYNGSISPEALNDTTVPLSINKKKAFAFNIDDVDAAQAAGSFEAWTSSAGKALAAVAEKDVLDAMLEGYGTITYGSGSTAVEAVLSLRTTLSNNNIPSTDRYLVVNGAAAQELLASVGGTLTTNPELRSGVLGSIYGFTVVESSQFDASEPTFVAYHSALVGYVGQVQQVETVRSTTAIADIVRGLNVYGTAVIDNSGVAVFVIGDAPSES
jgi:hypothetical protein